MIREMKVEMRKLFFRWDFYIAGIMLIGITSFFMYQLATEGTIIKIESTEPIDLTLNDVIDTIFSMSHHLGLIGILLAILCWNTFGKEVDHRSIAIYFLHSHDKWKLMLSKITVISIAVSMLFSLSFLSMLFIYFIFQPEHIQFAGTVSNYQFLWQSLCLMILCAVLFISIAAIIALSFGSIGVLVATIGLSILSSIFKDHHYIQDFLPLHLMDTLKMDSFLENTSMLLFYIIVVQIILWLIIRKPQLAPK